MKLVVGLGNPGRKYEKTRHNVGWMVLDQLGLAFTEESKFSAAVARQGEVIYCKPLTFMNNSGAAVRAIMDFYKLSPADVTLVYDDKDLPLGVVRLRSGGSAAGHNGVKSISQHLGTETIARIRVGITGQAPIKDTATFVLKKFTRKERATLEAVLTAAAEALPELAQRGITPQDHADLTV